VGLLPDSTDEWLVLRPLDGTDQETAGVVGAFRYLSAGIVRFLRTVPGLGERSPEFQGAATMLR
jgi:hypothetical protein